MRSRAERLEAVRRRAVTRARSALGYVRERRISSGKRAMRTTWTWISTRAITRIPTSKQRAQQAIARLDAAGDECPRCRAADLFWCTWLIEPFKRWYCACGATGRSGPSSQGLEEVPLPASLKTSFPRATGRPTTGGLEP